MERGTLQLDALKTIVLDEADRMLDMGFREDIEKILKSVPTERQCLFFSATMPRAIQDLIKRFTRDPQWVRIEAAAQNAPQVEQIYYEVDRRSKIEVLTRLIDLHDFRFGIIFCSTKIMVDELDEHLHARGYAVDRLHGDITQATRTRVMDKFRRRGFEFLIATDVAARGLDVDDLEVVFNFDLPNDAEDYTHRVGRTGRAGRKGKAFTFVSGREIYKLQNMIHYGRLKIRRERVPSLDEVEQAKGNVFIEKLRTTLEEKKFKPQDQVIDRLMEQGFTSTDIASALIHMMQSEDGAEAPKSPAKKIGGSGPVSSTPATKPVAKSQPFPAASKPIAASKPTAAAPAYIAPESDYVPEKRSAKPAASGDKFAAQKRTYERKPRTGREPGFATVSFNVGRQHLVTPADLVGKIAGVTRLPANIVGAIDIHEDSTQVDVLSEHAELVVTKLAGIRVKDQSLKPVLVPPSAG
jgi:ATP-dependent RNA helicase DeaD